jgi:TorA maturation chaperone TorD
VELLRALGALAEGTGPEQQTIAKALGLGRLDPADYTELFEFALYPYASVYLGTEGMLGGEARDRIAGFWRAIGAEPPEEPDHLATMLAFYARLRESAVEEKDITRRVAIERARAAFYWEHLASWLPIYLEKARTLATGPYAEWALMLQSALESEAAALPQPPALALHLREAPDFNEGDPSESLVAALLAPVRTGFILLRSDLRTIAESMGATLRQGERRYALDALLAQDRVAVLDGLRAHAERCADAYTALPDEWRDIRNEWRRRAASTAAVFASLATSSEQTANDPAST